MYPYEFSPKDTGIRHNEIFVVMPFAKEYDGVYSDLIEPATIKANESLGFTDKMLLRAYRTKEDIRTTSGWINILEHIFTSQITLGVLTSNNANVFYELGIAHATQPIARQILLAEKGYERTFDTKDLIYYEYDPENLAQSVEPLALRICDSIKLYEIEKERMIQKVRRFITPYGLDIILIYGSRRNFHIHRDRRDEYERTYGRDAFENLLRGMENLCQNGLIGLNTKTLKRDGAVVHIEYSYYWTSLGNDLLRFLNIINEDEVRNREVQMPDFF